MKNAQQIVKNFNDKREWSKPWCMKDLLLNITEETGEIWNSIKWLRDEKIEKAIQNSHDDFEDFVGDILYLIYKIAYISGVDSSKAFERTMKDYEKRFPIDKIKGKHTNVKQGGFDGKFENSDKNKDYDDY